MQKVVLYLDRTPRSWRGTWDPCGCDMARKATWQRHADPRAEVARTPGRATQVHADARVAPRGNVRGWQVMGPWVSGPRKEYWGGNAKALRRPTLYTLIFPLFPPCGTMSPLNLTFAGHVAKRGASDQSRQLRHVDRVDVESTGSPSKHVR